VQAIYYYWNSDGTQGPLVYGLLAGNRSDWCSNPSSCKIFYTTFLMLIFVSLITQYFVFSGQKELRRSKPYAPVKFVHPNANGVSFREPNGEDSDSSDEETKEGICAGCCEKPSGGDLWNANLHTPRSCWIFLTAVVLLSCGATYWFTFIVKWSGDTATNFLVGLLYILTNAFCLWSIIEFFCITVWFHAIRLVCDIPPLPKQDFRTGLPRQGRTFLAYCLLSKEEQSSADTFDTALQAHMDNLDPNMRITTGVVSVTSKCSLVKYELDRRDYCRNEIKRRLTIELGVVARLAGTGSLEGEDRQAVKSHLRQELHSVAEDAGVRVHFWLASYQAAKQNGEPLVPYLEAKVQEAASHLVYLHRTTTILKKPGQYQDLMVLATTGNNRAYTYLQADYGDVGRKEGSPCFGFSGKVAKDGDEQTDEDFKTQIKEFELRGQEDIDLVAGYGVDPKNHYFYTMVLDSDTVCPANSIRTLVESAEHPANKAYGLINANLANDYAKDADQCTWYMWRNALMEVSTVNLQRGQFWVFNRVGFYGKGLMRNEMYISRLIGMPGDLVEALPVDILSHDTVEAKLLQPAVQSSVTLYEDVARNPISAMSQSTRWMLGEVRNGCYHPDGTYRGIIKVLTYLYSNLIECKPRKEVFVRWREVPCSVSAEYLSHTGFRLFHAGPGILLINLASSLLARQKWGLELEILPGIGQYALLATALVLFIIPKGFLIFDKLPSLNLGKYLLCTKKASKIGDGTFDSSSEDDDDYLLVNAGPRTVRSEGEDTEGDSDPEEGEVVKLGRCSVLIRQIGLAFVEIALSILLFSPELVLGVIRLVRGSWSQVSGQQNWTPQDAVEREVEKELSLFYVFKKTWPVFLAGVIYVVYAAVFSVSDVLLYLLIVSWLLYPLTTYWMCLTINPACKKLFLWKWVMEIKRAQN